MIPYTRWYEARAPLLARLFLAIQFAVAAFFKMTAFSMQAAQTAAVGVPFATVAVALALILEMAGVLALLTGAYLRSVALLLAGYVGLLALLFYRDWSDPMTMGTFISHLGLIAALLYVSVYGARSFAVWKER